LAFGVAPKSREVSPSKTKEDIEMTDSVDEEEAKKSQGSPQRRSQSPQKQSTPMTLVKKKQRDHKNKRRKLRAFMNPDSNLIRDGAAG